MDLGSVFSLFASSHPLRIDGVTSAVMAVEAVAAWRWQLGDDDSSLDDTAALWLPVPPPTWQLAAEVATAAGLCR